MELSEQGSIEKLNQDEKEVVQDILGKYEDITEIGIYYRGDKCHVLYPDNLGETSFRPDDIKKISQELIFENIHNPFIADLFDETEINSCQVEFSDYDWVHIPLDENKGVGFVFTDNRYKPFSVEELND